MPGMYKVNPLATILTAKLMLDWLGETGECQSDLKKPWRPLLKKARSRPTIWAGTEYLDGSCPGRGRYDIKELFDKIDNKNRQVLTRFTE
jgi:hypothetical protein